MENILSKTKLAFIGCGVMAESIIVRLLREKLVGADQVSASHPRTDRRNELSNKYSISIFERNSSAVEVVKNYEDSIIILCVKPQKLRDVLNQLSGVVSRNQVILSIVAGATIKKISETLGSEKIVRAMPNTPSQIGCGITVWTCTDNVVESTRIKIKSLLTSLGRELYVESEHMIDMATSLSATGPTYVFLVMEALIDAGVHLGFSRGVSKELVQEMMLGAVLFAIESDLHPAELRNMVTSPGGTSADAIYQMEKGNLRTILSKAGFCSVSKGCSIWEEKVLLKLSSF